MPVATLRQGKNFAVLRRKILVILSRIPYPLEKGDKLRAFYQLRELAQNHDLVVCALSDSPPEEKAYDILGAFCKELHFFRLGKTGIARRLVTAFFARKPFQVAYFHSKSIHRSISQIIREHQPDHIYCQLIRTAEYARHSHTHKTLDYQDAFSVNLQRRLLSAAWHLRPLLQMEQKRVRRYESEIFECFDNKTIISYPDREGIDHPGRNQITVVPNGVDFAFFRPMERQKDYDIVFTGNMAYPPNVDGAEFLAREIMPHVWEELPGAKLVLAGATPSRKVRALAGPLVRVTGWVDDIRDYYARSKVFVAPMQIGSGLQNKVLEAMAMQVPCITSPLANKALMAEDGRDILIGTKAGEYAQLILSLLKNEARRTELGKQGHSFVYQHFNWENTCKTLESVITA